MSSKVFKYTCGCEKAGSYLAVQCPEHEGGRLILQPVTRDGRSRVTDETNKAQTRYGSYLQTLKAAGEILNFKLNSIKFRIGKQESGRDAWFKPDYAVWLPDRTLQMHEFKGHFEVAAKVRIKAAALLFPEVGFFAVYEETCGSYRLEEF